MNELNDAVNRMANEPPGAQTPHRAVEVAVGNVEFFCESILLYKLSLQEIRVLALVWLLSIVQGRAAAKIPKQRYIAQLTGIEEVHIKEILASLVKNKVLNITRPKEGRAATDTGRSLEGRYALRADQKNWDAAPRYNFTPELKVTLAWLKKLDPDDQDPNQPSLPRLAEELSLMEAVQEVNAAGAGLIGPETKISPIRSPADSGSVVPPNQSDPAADERYGEQGAVLSRESVGLVPGDQAARAAGLATPPPPALAPGQGTWPCVVCKHADASIHLAVVAGPNHPMKEVHLCGRCAREKGIHDSTGCSLVDLIGALAPEDATYRFGKLPLSGEGAKQLTESVSCSKSPQMPGETGPPEQLIDSVSSPPFKALKVSLVSKGTDPFKTEETSKGGPGGQVTDSVSRARRQREKAFMTRLQEHLPQNEMASYGGVWRMRWRRNPELLEHLLDELHIRMGKNDLEGLGSPGGWMGKMHKLFQGAEANKARKNQ